MLQPRLDSERTSILVLLAVLALSSLGFAILGLVLGPEFRMDLGQVHNRELKIVRPEAPDLSQLAEYWEKAGYLVIKRDESYELQANPLRDEGEVWIQGQETLVLVPQSHDLIRLSSAIFDLCAAFLEDGWSIQLEASDHGYAIGFWSSLPRGDRRVLSFLWQIELLNPHNYSQYQGGLIAVMGELFDPEGFLKGTPEAPIFAVIIDDWGYDTSAVEPMLAYPLPLTMAVLPNLVLSQEVSERANKAGHEVILHQPMEALNSNLDLGPGGITVAMDQEEIEAHLKQNAASLPLAVGFNNHMGSRVTEDSETMTKILDVAKELGLFFVDSRTSNASVVAGVAHEVGAPFGVNNLFIDNESDVEKIKTQVRAGLALAQKQGHAVVIGHVRSATAQALWEMIPEFLDSGVQLVPVSHVLQNP